MRRSACAENGSKRDNVLKRIVSTLPKGFSASFLGGGEKGFTILHQIYAYGLRAAESHEKDWGTNLLLPEKVDDPIPLAALRKSRILVESLNKVRWLQLLALDLGLTKAQFCC